MLRREVLMANIGTQRNEAAWDVFVSPGEVSVSCRNVPVGNSVPRFCP